MTRETGSVHILGVGGLNRLGWDETVACDWARRELPRALLGWQKLCRAENGCVSFYPEKKIDHPSEGESMLGSPVERGSLELVERLLRARSFSRSSKFLGLPAFNKLQGLKNMTFWSCDSQNSHEKRDSQVNILHQPSPCHWRVFPLTPLRSQEHTTVLSLPRPSSVGADSQRMGVIAGSSEQRLLWERTPPSHDGPAPVVANREQRQLSESDGVWSGINASQGPTREWGIRTAKPQPIAMQHTSESSARGNPPDLCQAMGILPSAPCS